MKTEQENKEFERFAFEFWNPLNQALYPNGEICHKIETCDFFKRKSLGYEILYCEKHPNACELNPFQRIK